MIITLFWSLSFLNREGKTKDREYDQILLNGVPGEDKR